MNSIVALPIAAAVPVAAPAMSAEAQVDDHPSAVLARAEQMVGDDAKLLELEEKIFDLIHAIDEFNPQEWSEASNKDADCDIEYARKFMIEMVGGECAEQLREQFAA
jgi:hypothetical protein